MVDSVSPIASFNGSQLAQRVIAAAATQPFSAVANVPVASSKTVYISPYITIDPDTHIVIAESRDPQTGAVINQYPSKSVVAEYRKISQGDESPAITRVQAELNGSPGLAQLADSAINTENAAPAQPVAPPPPPVLPALPEKAASAPKE